MVFDRRVAVIRTCRAFTGAAIVIACAPPWPVAVSYAVDQDFPSAETSIRYAMAALDWISSPSAWL